ncbi:MAG: nucleoside-diphosphate kinase [Waddliaceae bacterium]
MQAEQTLSIIKPDAVEAHHIGDIISHFESKGLQIAAMRMVQLSRPQAMEFYAAHMDRPFYFDLVNYMISGPIVAIVLEGDNAISRNREIIGATDPEKAEPGTLRAEFGTSIKANAAHGSNSPETAKMEIAFFFKPQEIVSRK